MSFMSACKPDERWQNDCSIPLRKKHSKIIMSYGVLLINWTCQFHGISDVSIKTFDQNNDKVNQQGHKTRQVHRSTVDSLSVALLINLHHFFSHKSTIDNHSPTFMAELVQSNGSIKMDFKKLRCFNDEIWLHCFYDTSQFVIWYYLIQWGSYYRR